MPPGRYGPISAADLKAVILEMVRGAMKEVITAHNPAVYKKTSYAGVVGGDIATEADLAAQRACERIRRRSMPWAGAVGEELQLRVACNLGMTQGINAYFTYDGLDGTKHFAAGARDGVGSMIAFVYNGRVVAAAIGDVFGGLIYLLDPTTGRVVLIDERNRRSETDLSAKLRNLPLTAGNVLWRGDRDDYDPLLASLLFDRHVFPHMVSRTNVSIGLSMAELWTEAATLHVQRDRYATPWDDTPIIGISQALGMVYLQVSGHCLSEITPALPTDRPQARRSVVVLHHSRIAELREYVSVVRISQAPRP